MADMRRKLAAVLEFAREQGVKFDSRFWLIMASMAAVTVILVFIPWNHS